MKYTSGPWKFIKDKPFGKAGHDYLISSGNHPNSKLVARVFKPLNITDAELEGNAKLIAAATELYEALVYLENYVNRELIVCHELDENSISFILEKPREAIKKATE